jgi:hypothetical protein
VGPLDGGPDPGNLRHHHPAFPAEHATHVRLERVEGGEGGFLPENLPLPPLGQLGQIPAEHVPHLFEVRRKIITSSRFTKNGYTNETLNIDIDIE